MQPNHKYAGASFFQQIFPKYCSMSSMQHVARCFDMQRARYSVTLLSRLQRVAMKNMQRVAQMTGSIDQSIFITFSTSPPIFMLQNLSFVRPRWIVEIYIQHKMPRRDFSVDLSMISSRFFFCPLALSRVINMINMINQSLSLTTTYLLSFEIQPCAPCLIHIIL